MIQLPYFNGMIFTVIIKSIKFKKQWQAGKLIQENAMRGLRPLTPGAGVEVTGKPVLYLGRRRNAYVDGLSLEESEIVLDKLWAHATQDACCYAHRWRKGDLLMWDNRSTLHRRDEFDPNHRRKMLRTQIKGKTVPRAA